MPGLSDLISHSLCYEELTFSEENGQVYKDLSLIANNRLCNLHKNEDGSNELSEIIVIDTNSVEDNIDQQYITFFQGKSFDGLF